MKFHDTNETIFALATPIGHSAIALFRISGPQTFKIIEKIFHFPSGKKIDKLKTHTIHYGHLIDHDFIDEAMLYIFRKPHSYTREDSAEISIHGSPYIIQRVSHALINAGAIHALPGEFSFRAFLNGRFDLSQVEAVADLIAARSDVAHHLAIQQFRGLFSNKIQSLRKELIHFISLIELELDFAEEDVEFAKQSQLIELIQNIINEINALLESFALGNVIKQGIPVAIIGRPNAGKSSLLNVLIGDDRAIVSDIPGTTRDTLEDTINIEGITFRFIDTAGLRKTYNPIESMGIERTIKSASNAEIILYIADLSIINVEEIQYDLEYINQKIENPQNKKIIIVGNKIDLMTEIPQGFSKYFSQNIVFISAKRKENIQLLIDALHRSVLFSKTQDQIYITNTRHYEALKKSYQALQSALESIKKGISKELLTIDLRQAMFHMGTITGEITTDDILNNIFSNFCIGK